MAELSCRMLHHGAAAASSSKAVIFVPAQQSAAEPSEIVYSSHAILNVACCTFVQVHGSRKTERVWKVYQSLRTGTKAPYSAQNTVATATAKRVITCVSQLHQPNKGGGRQEPVLVCGFSDGTITSWCRNQGEWTERVIVDADSEHFDEKSITDISGLHDGQGGYRIAICTSGGAYYIAIDADSRITKQGMVVHTAANVVRFQSLETGGTLILVGTAAPRQNKIHLFLDYKHGCPLYCGPLTGHEDWLTCFDWFSTTSSEMLASGSQDAKIRLWKFTSGTTIEYSIADAETPNPHRMDRDDREDDDDNVELEEDIGDGEARLEIVDNQKLLCVTLEALLIGHEERVTSVCWHPNPNRVYGQELILLSSGMDRTIFIWSEHESGIWTPVSRVGSAGGILGGPIGSTLLGFLNVRIEPVNGTWLLGHAYGGAIHLFSYEASNNPVDDVDRESLSVEERAALVQWRAQPCLTGHFDALTDLCWEAENGDYLVTVSNDQTCRIWIPLAAKTSQKENPNEEVWVEISRPQVHGHNLSAVTSLSTAEHRHRVISAAEEKEVRVFDATQAFVRLLQITNAEQASMTKDDPIQRVERAYIPSLGLSNKASAADGAEEDTSGGSEPSTSLPLERDLGSVSIWPEVEKLYGHSTEVVKLTSTLSARSGNRNFAQDEFSQDILVASSAKARDPDAARIRIWDVKENRCIQILAGGHRSTVVAISFSPDGRYLASSGKDRRLCLWQRLGFNSVSNARDVGEFVLADGIDSAHKRIVWGVHFCPFDSTILASGSRDGSVKIWKLVEDEDNRSGTRLKETFRFGPSFHDSVSKAEAVTALAFAPVPVSGMGILALGLECGIVELWNIPITGLSEATEPELNVSFPPPLCHVAAVTKLAWRPTRLCRDECAPLTLASGSSDHGCRIYEISWSE